ncbi:hypothetical protein [Shinella pollutisoli]|uniref:Tail terminator n=1 Tax=Shinella pollutisoli TaxID=2250594 RepID=A0ABV7D9J9_9HYPH|nr:hypothetical protein [Shinella pollutisoli]
MTTVTQARQAVRARIEAGNVAFDGVPVPLRWQNEDCGPLPDDPAPFVYVEFLNEGSSIVAYGGGRCANTHRNRCRVEVYAFVPKGWGLDAAESIAEQIATLLRSHRDQHVSCFDATVIPGGDGAMLTPPGLQSEVGNYFWAACEVSLFFDQTG